MSEVNQTTVPPVENSGEVVPTKEQILADLSEKYKDLDQAQLLEKVAEEFAKKEEIISHKNRAINAEKAKNKEVPPAAQTQEAPKTLSEEEIINKALEKFNQVSASKEVDAAINSLSADEEEKKAIKEAFENDIVKTGNVQEDLKKAIAIANANQLEQYRQTKTQSEVEELIMTKFSAGSPSGRSAEATPSLSPRQKTAAETLRALGHTEEQIKKAISGIK